MACNIKELKEYDVIEVWFKGELPVRGEVIGLTGGTKDKPKFVKAWIKNEDGTFRREIGDTMEDEPKVFYLNSDQVRKLELEDINKKNLDMMKKIGLIK